MPKRRVLFITANENERTAFLGKLEEPKSKETLEGGLDVTYGRFGAHDVTHFHSPNQGRGSLPSIMRVIHNIMPSGVVLVGIACGANVKNDEQKEGDVLISRKIYEHDNRKISEEGNEPRGAVPESGRFLYALFSGKAHDWKTKCGCGFYCGDIISSAVLLNNQEEKKKIFKIYHDNPIGYEMEGIDVYQACRDSGIQEWIIVKGISDFGDGKKTDEYQRIAAENAVSLCHYVFSEEDLGIGSDEAWGLGSPEVGRGAKNEKDSKGVKRNKAMVGVLGIAIIILIAFLLYNKGNQTGGSPGQGVNDPNDGEGKLHIANELGRAWDIGISVEVVVRRISVP